MTDFEIEALQRRGAVGECDDDLFERDARGAADRSARVAGPPAALGLLLI